MRAIPIGQMAWLFALAIGITLGQSTTAAEPDLAAKTLDEPILRPTIYTSSQYTSLADGGEAGLEPPGPLCERCPAGVEEGGLPRECDACDTPGSCHTPGSTCGGACRARGGLDYMVLGRVGGSYYDVPGESRMGFAYGVDLAAHVWDDWGIVGSINGNYIDDGTQLSGSIGAVKLPNANGDRWIDPFSFSIYFDQFTDTRIDTISGSLYLNQIRLQLGYALSECLEVGAIYSEPTNEETDINLLFLNFPNSLPVAGRANTSRNIGGYLSGRVKQVQWSALAGYRDSPGTLVLAGNLRRPLNDRFALFAGGSFEERRANWGAVFGVELSFGPRQHSACCALDSTSSYARAQSPDSALEIAYVPQGTTETPSTDLGQFPQGLGEASTPPLDTTPEELWTARYRNWNTRPLVILWAHEMTRALNYDGLTDDMQNEIQKAAGKVGPRTNGEIGRLDGHDNY